MLESVEEEMKAWSTRTGVTNVETDLKEEVKVFGDNEGEVSVFVAKSPLFDVYTFGAVCVYLTGMYGVVMMMHGEEGAGKTGIEGKGEGGVKSVNNSLLELFVI